MKTSSAAERATVLAFAAIVFIGGGNFIAIKFSNLELDPLFGGAFRFTSAAVIFFVLTRLMRIPAPNARELYGSALYGLLSFGVAFGLLYFALTGLAAGTASVIMAVIPLLTLVFAVLHGQDSLTRRNIVAGILALVGIAVLSIPTIGGGTSAIYFVTAILGAAAIAEGSVVLKGIGHPNPIVTNGVAVTAGAVLLWIASFAFGETWALPEEPRTWYALGYLVLVGSVVLFILFIRVIKVWTASATVYAIALMPVVAVTLGSLLADELITRELVGGAAIVMAAVYLGTTKGHPHHHHHI